jgi:hypothetical protein
MFGSRHWPPGKLLSLSLFYAFPYSGDNILIHLSDSVNCPLLKPFLFLGTINDSKEKSQVCSTAVSLW